MLDFLKLAGTWACPAGTRISVDSGYGCRFVPVAGYGRGCGTDFSTRIRIYKIIIRTNFIRCHLFMLPTAPTPENRRMDPTRLFLHWAVRPGVGNRAGLACFPFVGGQLSERQICVAKRARPI
jgi:hypothetical protein